MHAFCKFSVFAVSVIYVCIFCFFYRCIQTNSIKVVDIILLYFLFYVLGKYLCSGYTM